MKKGIFEPGLKRDSTVLIPIIKQYLAAHKRLVVPQLGAFIVKEPERSIVFSELLKRDDGVLRGLLRDGGTGDLEAAGEIDRFVFEVRHAVERGQEYPLEGLGVMKPGPNGTIAFVYALRLPRRFPAVKGLSARLSWSRENWPRPFARPSPSRTCRPRRR